MYSIIVKNAIRRLTVENRLIENFTRRRADFKHFILFQGTTASLDTYYQTFLTKKKKNNKNYYKVYETHLFFLFSRTFANSSMKFRYFLNK